jgi:hypothetical protein
MRSPRKYYLITIGKIFKKIEINRLAPKLRTFYDERIINKEVADHEKD